MLSRTSFDQAYIDGARKRLEEQFSAFDELAKAAGDGAELQAFEPLFNNQMVVVLDASFVHRARGNEAKKGALKEARELATSIIEGEGATISRADFERLSADFFAELEERFRA